MILDDVNRVQWSVVVAFEPLPVEVSIVEHSQSSKSKVRHVQLGIPVGQFPVIIVRPTITPDFFGEQPQRYIRWEVGFVEFNVSSCSGDDIDSACRVFV